MEKEEKNEIEFGKKNEKRGKKKETDGKKNEKKGKEKENRKKATKPLVHVSHSHAARAASWHLGLSAACDDVVDAKNHLADF